MKQIKLINLENASEEEASKYAVREASRAVVSDLENKIALLHSTANKYYKLPGGGIENGEDPITALRRECLEEIGCNIQSISGLGMITEYRKKHNLRQISYCYYARVKGDKGKAELTTDEIEEGFETVWLPIVEAVEVARIVGDPTVYEAPYMVARDSAFLLEASKLLK